MFQTGVTPGPAAELLQRLQSYGPVPTLSHAGHPLRETPPLLLHAPASAISADMAIARGPRPGQVTADATDGRAFRLGPGAALARTGRPPPR